jgi:predicted transposase/invertase (TIGR01784 family)
MANEKRKGGQASQYDKIIKENLEITLPVIIKDVLGLDIAQSEELPDDIQHTKERKPDALKKVTDTAGRTYVLQVEFQIEDEREMVYRMAEYSVMLMRRYQLPVKQYVIFLRDTEPAMSTYIDTENHKFSYNLVRIAEASYKLFLKVDNPEVKMLGILANFGKEDSYRAVKSIVDQVQSFTKGDFAESRYFKQLRIFVQLRSNIEQQLEKAMETVSKFFKEEKDFLYRKGEVKGREEERLKFVTNLVTQSGFPDEQIAGMAGVPVNFVKNVREGLKK